MLCICKSVESREIYHVPVVWLWVGRGKRSEATLARSFPLDMYPILPLAALAPGLQAGMCCQAKPGVGFLGSVHCPKGWRGMVPPRSIVHFISVSVLAFELRSCVGRSLITQQRGSAFAKLLFGRGGNKQKKPQASRQFIFFFPLPLSSICA